MTDFNDILHVRRVIDGHTNDFVYIVRRYEKMVFTIVNKIVANRTEAEDITQEVFIKVFKSLDKFREESSFATWLYRIAYNVTISELRKRKFHFATLEDNSANIPDDDTSYNTGETSKEELLKYLDIILKKLPPGDALLITMYYMNNQSMQEIADITGLSVSNAKIKLYRIRKIMNFELNKLIQQ
ncbi:RNA polymerase sigma factor [Dysgonomonas sp. 511]|uniref:RNA polymerase sigma factor n=1 Tax=Dysgonomonas sp. 511 TaxID=2302930 RepID=UPI0013D18E53|nr:sigma-70 family RNA polymerase sigma factor [Dysgonomonas sp. 511]NDV77607.1 sigma-70 family RNA polymerase sigma factor [Dysgonomonas sp. 511]